jgi:energy-coupling factor transporter ATP-binding protein EcfA2
MTNPLEFVASWADDEPKSSTGPRTAPRSTFDVEAFIEKHGLKVRLRSEWRGGDKWVLETCPFNPEHTNNSAIITRVNGAPGFMCQHTSCAGLGWKELRERLEPGYRKSETWNPRPDETRPSRFERIEDLPRVEDIGAINIEWDVEELIPRGTIVLLTGEAGCGKSTLACALGYAVSQGLPFLGRDTMQRPVLILDAENPAIVVVERFRRLGIITDDQFITWGQWTGEDPPSAGGAIVLEWVARCDPKPLIVVDSFIRFHPGAENSSSETQAYMSQYRRLTAIGATVILLHHTGKAETAQDYRGSSDIKAGIDIAYKLTNLGDGTRLSDLELRAFKQRLSVTPRLSIRYEAGKFMADQREAVKTVTEKLVDLLKANPGITTANFEKRAVEKGLGRKPSRTFLANGLLTGTIIAESKGNRRMHTWREVPEETSWVS